MLVSISVHVIASRLIEMGKKDITIEEARRIQIEMLDKIDLNCAVSQETVKVIAGVDASYLKGSEKMFAAVCVYCFPELELIESHTGSSKVEFPYIPGYLAFREAPSIIATFKKVRRKPDLILVDGHGIAHPRGVGIASHLGVLLGIPTIGVAKTLLVGEYTEPSLEAGSFSPVVYNEKTVGVALRTREGVSVVIVSPGHGIDLDSAVELTLRCCRGYRIPEPVRMAHLLANRARLAYQKRYESSVM